MGSLCHPLSNGGEELAERRRFGSFQGRVWRHAPTRDEDASERATCSAVPSRNGSERSHRRRIAVLGSGIVGHPAGLHGNIRLLQQRAGKNLHGKLVSLNDHVEHVGASEEALQLPRPGGTAKIDRAVHDLLDDNSERVSETGADVDARLQVDFAVSGLASSPVCLEVERPRRDWVAGLSGLRVAYRVSLRGTESRVSALNAARTPGHGNHVLAGVGVVDGTPTNS